MKKALFVLALLLTPNVSLANGGGRMNKISANTMLVPAVSILGCPSANPERALHYMPSGLLSPMKSLLVIAGRHLPTISRYPHGLFYNFFVSSGKSEWVKPMIQERPIVAIPAIEIKVIP